jgi:hypothetical protein
LNPTIEMDETAVRRAFERLVADEPPFAAQMDPVLGAGRKARRRRLFAQGVLALCLTGVAIAVLAWPGPDEAPAPIPSKNEAFDLAARVTKQGVPSRGPADLPAPRRGVFGKMFDAIRASTPKGWRLALTADRLDGDWILDGDVEDGSGPGRLLVVVSARTGSFVGHPCADREFRQGGACIERPLAGGALLVLRGVVDFEGNKTIDVGIVHADGSGLLAEAGNWSISRVGPGGMPRVTRSDPLYAVEQLADLLLAVDHETRECLPVLCE